MTDYELKWKSGRFEIWKTPGGKYSIYDSANKKSLKSNLNFENALWWIEQWTGEKELALEQVERDIPIRITRGRSEEYFGGRRVGTLGSTQRIGLRERLLMDVSEPPVIPKFRRTPL